MSARGLLDALKENSSGWPDPTLPGDGVWAVVMTVAEWRELEVILDVARSPKAVTLPPPIALSPETESPGVVRAFDLLASIPDRAEVERIIAAASAYYGLLDLTQKRATP